MSLVSKYSLTKAIRGLRHEGVALRGITKVIKKVFAPSYTYAKLKCKPLNIGGFKFGVARRRGKALDKALSSTSRLPEAVAIKQALLARGWTTIHTQLPVAMPLYRIGTCIDMLCQDSQGHYIVIETKLGCKYRDATTGNYMKHCLTPDNKPVKETTRHMHELQCLLGRDMFIETYSLPAFCALVYVDADQVNVTTDFNIGRYDQSILNNKKSTRRKKRKIEKSLQIY
jgi:hypothetical protein